jgi:D-apionolactonase
MEPQILPREVLLFGSKEYVPTRREIRAGPLSAVLQDGVVRYVKFGETEIVRRLYMALRDQNWNTIPTTYSNWNYNIKANSFRISFTAENKKGDINYRWEGSIVGDGTGQLTFAMRGQVLSGFKKRIIGLCALFPIREYAGLSTTVVRRNNEKLSATFPYYVSSQQPLPGFDDVSEVDCAIDGADVQVKFEGDQFEMEDQRSFTDASYKVYSTWSRRDEPDIVKEGERVDQSISISVSTSQTRNTETLPEMPTTIEVESNGLYAVPKIGLGLSTTTNLLSANEIALLKMLKLSHLRVDLDLSSENWNDALQTAHDQSQQLDTSLEIALFINSKNSLTELSQFKDELQRLQPLVSSIIVLDQREFVSSPESVQQCQQVFGSYFSHPQIAGGTDRNYFDLGYAHPSYNSQCLVSYPVNPQVHAFDVSSLAETLEGQSWTLSSAHRIYGNNPIVISPVTLRPRFNPDAIAPEQVDPGELPPQVDQRQLSLFGASWTAGSIKSLAESRAYSLTYYETVGWRGVIETEKGSSLPEKFFSRPRMVFPLYHVLADINEMSRGMIRAVRSNRSLLVGALCVTNGGFSRLLLYNLTWVSQKVSIRGIVGSILRVRQLNENTVEKAMFNSSDFRAESLGLSSERDQRGVLDLKLLPYEVITIDWTE